MNAAAPSTAIVASIGENLYPSAAAAGGGGGFARVGGGGDGAAASLRRRVEFVEFIGDFLGELRGESVLDARSLRLPCVPELRRRCSKSAKTSQPLSVLDLVSSEDDIVSVLLFCAHAIMDTEQSALQKLDDTVDPVERLVDTEE
jgi:hypothetical protein